MKHKPPLTLLIWALTLILISSQLGVALTSGNLNQTSTEVGVISPTLDADIQSFMGIGDIKNQGNLTVVANTSGASPTLDVDVSAGTLTLENSAVIANKQNVNVDTGVNVVDSFADTTGEGCVWHLLCIKDGNRRVGTFMATWNASTNDIEYANVSTKDIGTVDLTFTTDISSENVRLLATATSDDWEVRVIRQLI